MLTALLVVSLPAPRVVTGLVSVLCPSGSGISNGTCSQCSENEYNSSINGTCESCDPGYGSAPEALRVMQILVHQQMSLTRYYIPPVIA